MDTNFGSRGAESRTGAGATGTSGELRVGARIKGKETKSSGTATEKGTETEAEISGAREETSGIIIVGSGIQVRSPVSAGGNPAGRTKSTAGNAETAGATVVAGLRGILESKSARGSGIEK